MPKKNNTAPQRRPVKITEDIPKDKKSVGMKIEFNEVLGVVVLLLAILVSLGIYFDGYAGIVGEGIKYFLTGVFGITAYVLPLFILAISLMLIFRLDNKVNRLRFYAGLFIVIFFSGIYSSVTIDFSNYTNMGYFKICSELYTLGAAGQSGGFLGGAIAIPLVGLFSEKGAVVILVFASIISLLVLTQISLIDIAKALGGLFKGMFMAFRRTLLKHRIESEQRRKETEMRASERREREERERKKREALMLERRLTEADIRAEHLNRRTEAEEPFDFDEPTRRPAVKRDTFKIGDTAQYSPAFITDNESGAVRENTVIKPDIAANMGNIAIFTNDDDDVTESVSVTREERTVREKKATAPSEATASPDEQTDNGGKTQAEKDFAFQMSKSVVEKASVPPPRLDESSYIKPDIDILRKPPKDLRDEETARKDAKEQAIKIEQVLNCFDISAKVVNVVSGPAVTRYELKIADGIKVQKITGLQDNIAMSISANGLRVQAPIPGKPLVGIEAANKRISTVFLREGIESNVFVQHPSNLAVVLGKNISGDIIVSDLYSMPHLLVAGATGSGKSVCINAIIMSILYKTTPDKVKIILVDPKLVELGVYNGIPHLLIPVVTDPKKAALALQWACNEMENRYKNMANVGARDINGYNMIVNKTKKGEPMCSIVIIIDELADLMMLAPQGVEDAIQRLTQKARAAGIHMIIATQRPSVNVITGVIKANIPSRIAFAVSSQVDSKVIIDKGGAEHLLGRGDMLYVPIGEREPIRVQGAYVSDSEVEEVVSFIKKTHKDEYDSEVLEQIEDLDDQNGSGGGAGNVGAKGADELLESVIEYTVESETISVSVIQRKFGVGHSRAGRIVDQMEERKIVGPSEGSKPRKVLLSKSQWLELKASGRTVE